MKVRYLPRAIKDLENIRRYIAKDNPSAAWVVASFIRSSIRSLVNMPHRGRATEEKNVRRLVVTNYPYVVNYRVQGKDIVILTVMHARQNR